MYFVFLSKCHVYPVTEMLSFVQFLLMFFFPTAGQGLCVDLVVLLAVRVQCGLAYIIYDVEPYPSIATVHSFQARRSVQCCGRRKVASSPLCDECTFCKSLRRHGLLCGPAYVPFFMLLQLFC